MQQNIFSTYPVYTGDDLGLNYSPAFSTFRVWCPTATAARIILYPSGTGEIPLSVHPMKSDIDGTWFAHITGKLAGNYYVYQVLIDEMWTEEVVDPYTRFTGTNGRRAQIEATNAADPDGWIDEHRFFNADAGKNTIPGDLNDSAAAIIYEMHIRDMTMHVSSGVKKRGKFAGLTERDTVNKNGLATGLDHLVDLGITHVQLLPVFDFYSVDESKKLPGYNWGYDPLLFQTPEGSYASDASDGRVRVRELKELVMTFHRAGLKVILDMALNHTALTQHSSFNILVPGYYYRQLPDGNFSDASGCGNETASERPMMRKFMIDTLKYWVEHFHVDGFRIDLMGVHDIETMNIISNELRAMRPDILLYGEGWSANPSPLPEIHRAVKKNVQHLQGIAVFGDEFRDGIRGSVFFNAEKGFVSGCAGLAESVKFGIVACCPHPQINYSLVNYSNAPYATKPQQVISYCECHDNLNLWDKLNASATDADTEERKNMHLLAISILLTSQGITFLHAGSEFLRSKYGVDNSFNSGDEINAINWDLKSEHQDVFAYTRYLIRMRRTHPLFRLTSAKRIVENILFMNSPEGVIVYTINGKNTGDEWKQALLVFNGSASLFTFQLPEGSWKTAVVNNRQSTGNSFESLLDINPRCCVILYQ